MVYLFYFPINYYTNELFIIIMINQELNAPNMYDTSAALNGLACFLYPDLARDIANDIMTLVSCGASCPPPPACSWQGGPGLAGHIGLDDHVMCYI